MKNLIRIVLCLLLSVTSASSLASTFRCGSQLVSLGDRSFQVLKKCGEPIARETIGYTIGEYNHRELHIQEWVYGPNNGMYHFLRFEGNRLTNIESQRDQ
ncbi:MAG: DUF2845 domain-containing protein [Pseudomonas sp.]|nr:DUF2845 domain-containing protein [Pseudomonas sp.]